MQEDKWGQQDFFRMERNIILPTLLNIQEDMGMYMAVHFPQQAMDELY